MIFYKNGLLEKMTLEQVQLKALTQEPISMKRITRKKILYLWYQQREIQNFDLLI